MLKWKALVGALTLDLDDDDDNEDNNDDEDNNGEVI